MYVKIKKLYYKLDNTLSLLIENLVSTIEPKVPYSSIAIEEPSGYSMHVNYACVAVHEYQVKLAIKDVIKSVFKDFVSNIYVHFEPRDKLTIKLTLGSFIPVKIDGRVEIKGNYNTLVYKFDNIHVMKLPVNALLDTIRSIPGVSLSFDSGDGKAKVDNDHVDIFIKEFVKDLDLEIKLSDVYFTEKDLIIELKGKPISELKSDFSFELPESYAYILGDKLKINNIEINEPKIAVFKEDGSTFSLNIFNYLDLVRQGSIKYTNNDEIIIQIAQLSGSTALEKSNDSNKR